MKFKEKIREIGREKEMKEMKEEKNHHNHNRRSSSLECNFFVSDMTLLFYFIVLLSKPH